jgi:hypothetical protein
MRPNNKNKQPKKDINLMTLLAFESTGDARRLLKKYGLEDAKSYGDLEIKLAELYTSVDDKLQLEKDLAEIHPHKKWLLRTIGCKCQNKPTVEETDIKKAEIAPPTVSQIDNLKSNADGSESNKENNALNLNNLIAVGGMVFMGALVLTIVTITLKSIKD